MSSIKHRHLSMASAPRRALLRNLVCSLLTHSSITTTYPRAKEAQRLADQLVTLGKKNTIASLSRASSILFDPPKQLPMLKELVLGFKDRPGGYTRVLRCEPEDRDGSHRRGERRYNEGQNETAVLEWVGGKRDVRWAVTVRAVVRQRELEERRERLGEDAEGDGEGVVVGEKGVAERGWRVAPIKVLREYAETQGAEGWREAGVDKGKGRGMAPMDVLAANVRKVTRYKEDGEEAFMRDVERLEAERDRKRDAKRERRRVRESEAGSQGDGEGQREGGNKGW